MLPFGLQLATFENLRHFPMNLEIFDIDKEKERDSKVFGNIKTKQDSKKKREKIKKNVSSKHKK